MERTRPTGMPRGNIPPCPDETSTSPTWFRSEVHGRLEDRVMEERRAAVVDGAHAPDGDAPWKHPALPRRDEHVTDLDLRAVARHVLEPEHAARLALDD